MNTPQWGYERADCRGSYALSLFLDDMDKLITHYTSEAAKRPDAVLFQAQAAANKLLQAYQKNARNTVAFTNQFIEIKSLINNQNQLQLVPIFSAGLKEKLVELLHKSNQTSLH
ncbi:hypothetical protein H0A66_03665 [Alcaligenaceae bacterium]|nr:hypothetical protein [Alcaligenaceae bacterium]